jgi:hypothetical protein
MDHMNKLQLTMDALQTALADAPETPTAWVPLRRVAVEEALRMLGGVGAAVDALRRLESEIDDDRPVWLDAVVMVDELATQVTTVHTNGNGNGAMTITHTPAERLTYTQPARAARKTAPAPDKTTNSWRRKPKAERLALVCAEIARMAGERTWVTQVEFDRSKPASMPSASSMVQTLELTWIELVCKALPLAVVPAAQPAKRKEPAAPAAEPFRDSAAED